MSEESIFYEAAEKTTPEERAAFLDEACGDDAELRDRIEVRLCSHEQANRFLAPTDDNPPRLEDASVTVDETRGESERSRLSVGLSDRLFGDYELQEEIARGGMGVVYRARQVSVNRLVALKMILAGNLAHDKEIERFRVEAEAAANLDHPNIVPIYEVNDHQNQHYFSMKLIQGHGLNRCISQYINDPIRAARVMETVARAVHHAHLRGILHRDLKPGNILLDTEGEPYVADFGLAKKIDRQDYLTQSGAVVGTPEYMSPEQAAGQKGLTITSDVYSLGAILYALLTGKPPLQGEHLLETLQQVVNTEPLAPSQLEPTVPKDLETICLKCLNKDPSKRYDSAEQFAEDLQRFQNNEPITARPAGQLERAWRWCRRNPTVASLLTVLVMVFVAGSASSTYFAISEQRRADAEQRAKEQLAKQQTKTETALIHARNETAIAKFVAYSFEIDAARRALLEGDFSKARDLLEMTNEDLRGWEYNYLYSQVKKPKLNFGTSAEFLWSAVFSPDGKWIISTGEDETVEVRDSQTGEEHLTLRGHTNWVRSVAVSADGKWIVSASDDNSVKVWDADTGKESRTLGGHNKGVRCVVSSSDGKHIASGDGAGVVRVWDLATGENALTLEGHTGSIWSVAISPNGRWVVSSSDDNTVKVWDSNTGKESQTFVKGKNSPRAVAFSPNSERIVVGLSDVLVGKVEVWDLASRELALALKYSGRINSVAFSPDGKQIVGGGFGGDVKVWESVTDVPLRLGSQSPGGCVAADQGTVRMHSLLLARLAMALKLLP